jgi:hypothetical protein
VTAYRLLALDIDGTLLASDKKITHRTRAAVEAARACGVHVVLVTGRRYPAARRVAEDLGGHVPLVLHNGALIVDQGLVLRCVPLARATALTAVRVGRAAGADPVVHCGHAGEGRLLVEAISPANTLLAYYLDRSHPDVCVMDDLAALAEDPIQVMFGGTVGAMDGLLSLLRAALGAQARIERTVYPRNDTGLLDVLDPRVGKAEALGYLQRRFDVAASETLAIGDNWNDHEMLEAAGLGLVMGNADPQMLKLGLPLLPTNDEDGVAVAVERHILSR